MSLTAAFVVLYHLSYCNHTSLQYLFSDFLLMNSMLTAKSIKFYISTMSQSIVSHKSVYRGQQVTFGTMCFKCKLLEILNKQFLYNWPEIFSYNFCFFRLCRTNNSFLYFCRWFWEVVRLSSYTDIFSSWSLHNISSTWLHRYENAQNYREE